MEKLSKSIGSLVKELFDIETEVILTRTEPKFGDYSTNIAMQLTKELGQKPQEIATKLVDKIARLEDLSSADIAGPGFINIRLKEQVVLDQLSGATDITQTLVGKTIVAEYSDPNPFKTLHAGHLYTSVVGDAIANLLELAGAKVYRVNYGGDVGLHVGKTMWSILKSLGGEFPGKLANYQTTQERTTWLASCYVEGTSAYEDDESAKLQIIELNKKIYQVHSLGDKSSNLAQIYWTTRQWSYDYFDDFYEKIGVKFDKYYPESSVVDLGLAKVNKYLDQGIFEESDGAVIFDGEKHGLHTRVFVNSQGLPTYEAKEIGLIFTKKQDYDFDESVVITGNEQEQYMAVVLKAIEQFAPDLTNATRHLTHGLVKLSGGQKMSSRRGNILLAKDVLEFAKQAHLEAQGTSNNEVELGAIKYAFLKVRTGGDIIYDPKESMSLEGNSGPYLQYAYARAAAILRKSDDSQTKINQLTEAERSLAVKIIEFKDVCSKSCQGLSPHVLCTYLYELTQEFNRFYEHNRVLGDDRQAQRIALLRKYSKVLETGLNILGIPVLEKM